MTGFDSNDIMASWIHYVLTYMAQFTEFVTFS